jgi:hypothetical protein
MEVNKHSEEMQKVVKDSKKRFKRTNRSKEAKDKGSSIGNHNKVVTEIAYRN